MIDQDKFRNQVDALEEGLRKKLGVRGKSLDRRLKRAGRLLPKRVRAAGQILTETQRKLVHPTLLKQVNPGQVTSAFATFNDHLKTIDPADRRKGKVLNWCGGMVLNFLAVGVLVAVVLRWQDLI